MKSNYVVSVKENLVKRYNGQNIIKQFSKNSFFQLKRSLSSPELHRSDLRTGLRLRTADFYYSLFLEKEKINNLQFLANTEKISVIFSEMRE